MSINSIGGLNQSTAAQSARPTGMFSSAATRESFFAGQLLTVTRNAGGQVVPHQFMPGDPLNQYLTDEDRSTITAATGIKIDAAGNYLTPMSMGVNQVASTMDAVGQIAADRANGTVTGSLSVDAVNQMIQQFAQRIAANQDPFPNAGVDVTA